MLEVTAPHAINVCAKTKPSRQNHVVKHALSKGATNPIGRRGIAICTTLAIVAMEMQVSFCVTIMPVHALSKGATIPITQRGSAEITIHVCVEMA